MTNSYFIVIDGMDGCGKSYMISQLHNYLFSKDKKYRILTTREPTTGTYGKEIREMLANDATPEENSKQMVDLFIKDREEHLKNVIEPFLSSSKGDDINIVLCDRYYHSTIAFQSTQGVSTDSLIEKNKGFLTPTKTFILDLDPEIALSRMKSREKEKFEEKEFMEGLRENFLKLPKLLDEDILVVDASGSKEEVFSKIKEEVEKIL